MLMGSKYTLHLQRLMFALLLPFMLLSASRGSVVTTSLSPEKIAVGDQVHFSVHAVVPNGAAVSPLFSESDFGKVTVREWNLVKSERETTDSLLYDYNITTYVPEPCTIPSLHFLLEHNGMADTLSTEPVPLQVISVLPSDTVDIVGMKSPLSAGKRPKWWLWLTIIIAGGILIAVAAMVIWRKFRRPPPLPPPVPPYEEALDALSQLGVKKYLERGLVREFVFELSEIFKRYIARRFDCNASDFTTEEMVAWSGAGTLQKQQRASIEWFFRTTDPVKFARLIPDNVTIERFEVEVRAFLEATKPVIEPVVEQPAAPLSSSGGAAK